MKLSEKISAGLLLPEPDQIMHVLYTRKDSLDLNMATVQEMDVVMATDIARNFNPNEPADVYMKDTYMDVIGETVSDQAVVRILYALVTGECTMNERGDFYFEDDEYRIALSFTSEDAIINMHLNTVCKTDVTVLT